jgi:hypothetical protein
MIKKINKLRGDLHMLETDQKLNKHKVFLEN